MFYRDHRIKFHVAFEPTGKMHLWCEYKTWLKNKEKCLALKTFVKNICLQIINGAVEVKNKKKKQFSFFNVHVSSIGFPLALSSLHPLSLGMFFFCFSIYLQIFNFPCYFFLWPIDSVRMCYFHLFSNFSVFLLSLISRFIPLWLEKLLCIISILLNLFRIILWPNIYGLSWRMCLEHLRRLCILLLDGLSWIRLLDLPYL